MTPLIKSQPVPVLRKLLSCILYTLLPSIVIIHFYFDKNHLYRSPDPAFISPNLSQDPVFISPNLSQSTEKNVIHKTSCDYTDGEWVPNSGHGPLYNGFKCETIKPGQNCMLFGRPDDGFLHWRWKPRNCKLPGFDPETFLKLMRNKHVAFVGDSLARNQLESLLCMLSSISKPKLYYTVGEDNKFRKWRFEAPYNVNMSIYWSPFLVKGVEKTPEKNYNTMYMDILDEKWRKDLENMDMLVMSVGYWYLLSEYFYYKDSLIGCHYLQNCTEVGFYGSYGKALELSFGAAIEKARGGKGMSVFLTTYSPAHFEGEWDKFGACPKTKPYKESEMALEGVNEEMRRVGVEKVQEAKLKASRELGDDRVWFEALDITKLALLRPDGHPGAYKSPFPFAKGIPERVQNDCVHWCLPGPVDTWNEILLDMMKRRWGSLNKEKM